jgi:hypothetical protein
MKKMTFVLLVPSHVYSGLHLLERMRRLCLVGAQQQYVRSMKGMTFTLSVPSHVYVGLHQLKRMCRLRLVGVQQQICSTPSIRDVSVE